MTSLPSAAGCSRFVVHAFPPRRPFDSRFRAAVAALAAAVFVAAAPPARALDVDALWDRSSAAASEQRFRQALESARGDEALILQTQIARTYGLRRDFERARSILKEIEPRIAAAGAEAQTRYFVELGRTYASAVHTPADVTPQNREAARQAFLQAIKTARAGRLDGLAVDAIHMMAFVDTTPADALRWGEQALAVIESSDQPAAKRWEASIRKNVGYALHQLGRYDDALDEFRKALALREKGNDARATRTARWMIAWTLRALKRNDEAVEMLLQLEREGDLAGQPDPFVFQELEIHYRARGDAPRAQHYADRRRLATARRVR